jgi:hypothetical protein
MSKINVWTLHGETTPGFLPTRGLHILTGQDVRINSTVAAPIWLSHSPLAHSDAPLAYDYGVRVSLGGFFGAQVAKPSGVANVRSRSRSAMLASIDAAALARGVTMPLSHCRRLDSRRDGPRARPVIRAQIVNWGANDGQLAFGVRRRMTPIGETVGQSPVYKGQAAIPSKAKLRQKR